MNRTLSTLSALTTAGLVESPLAAAALGGEHDLGYLAVQAPGAEGVWSDLKIEGAIPKELNGDLYRVAPGQKKTFGVTLRHLFNGDAFLTKYQIRDGQATVRGRFVGTPERSAELAESKMLFNEFGTLAPAPGRGGKNQPSINVIRWDGRLLALSEDGQTFSETVLETRNADAARVDQICVDAERLRAVAQQARLDWEQHERTHGCLRKPAAKTQATSDEGHEKTG